MIISISGVDGSGKTTLAKSLAKKLGKKEVTRYVFLGDYFLLSPIVRFIHLFSRKSTTAKNPFLNTRPKKPWQRIWIVFAIFDNLLRYSCLHFLSVVFGYNFICDRYFYDRLAGLEFYEYSNHFLSKLYLFLTPRPDLAVFLNTDERSARKREVKEKHNLAFYRRLSKIYKRLADELNIEIINSGKYNTERIINSIIIPKLNKK